MAYTYSTEMLELTRLYMKDRIKVSTYAAKIANVLKKYRTNLDKAFDEMKRIKNNLEKRASLSS